MDGPCQVKINLFCSSVTVDLAETSIGSHFNLTESDRSPRKPECSSDPRTLTKPQNKFIDTVSVFNCTRSTQYDEIHRSAPQNTMPMEFAYSTLKSFLKFLTQNWDVCHCISFNLAGLPDWKFSRISIQCWESDDLLNSFLAVSAHAQMEN